MNRIFLIISLLLLCFKTHSQQTIQVQGEVHGTWDVDTVLVVGNLIVPEGKALALNPGCVVQFNGFFSIDIKGSMQAIGTAADSIKFTVPDTLGFSDLASGLGGWNRITIDDLNADSDSSIFEHCRFEYSKTDTFQLHGGVFFIRNSSQVRISNSTFYHNRSFVNGGAIYLYSSRAIIKQNTFESTYAGTNVHWGYGGAICGVYSMANISNNTFRSNTSTGIGGGCSFEFTIPHLNANVFENNFSALGGAFGVLRASSGGLVSNNLCIGNGSTYFGGAIALVAASPVLANNTLVNNYSIYGGGLYCNEASCPLVYNSIFWGNVAYAGYGRQIFLIDALSQPKIHNSLFEHGASDFTGSGYSGEYVNCLETNPLFFNLQPHPFSLSESSAGIDVGSNQIPDHKLPDFDLAGNPRISNNLVDLGAFEFQSPNIITPPTLTKNSLKIHYNPIAKNLSINLKLPKDDNLILTVYSIKGNLVAKYNLGFQMAGEVIMNIPNFLHNGAGLYVGSITGAKTSFTAKFIAIQ
jgi:hypothetical protein